MFLTNDDFDVAILGDEELISFYSSPYEGREGTFDDLIEEYRDMAREDREWLYDIAKRVGRLAEIPDGEGD